MDEISTGLDSATTFLITKCLSNFCHIMDATLLVALLQPAPETYNLFDDVMLLSQGQIVFHGPREEVYCIRLSVCACLSVCLCVHLCIRPICLSGWLAVPLSVPLSVCPFGYVSVPPSPSVRSSVCLSVIKRGGTTCIYAVHGHEESYGSLPHKQQKEQHACAQVMPFFSKLGFQCPEAKGDADFLQDVTIKTGQGLFRKDQRQKHDYMPVQVTWLPPPCPAYAAAVVQLFCNCIVHSLLHEMFSLLLMQMTQLLCARANVEYMTSTSACI